MAETTAIGESAFASDSTKFSRRMYLISVWLWLVICLTFPTWRGRIYQYDSDSEQWRSTGAFGITGSGNPMTSVAPLWNPPRSSGGLPSVVRLPLSPITANQHIEILITSTFWRFTMGLLVAGFFVFVVRPKSQINTVDPVLMIAKAIFVSLLTANIVLIAIGAASMGFALIDPVVYGVLGVGLCGGIGIGIFVKNTNNQDEVANAIHAEMYSDEAGEVRAVTAETPATPTKGPSIRDLRWWWRIPIYFVFQLFVWTLIARQSWPTGRDVFGPYKLHPGAVEFAFWVQFVLLPFIARRFQLFALSELFFAVFVYVLPKWPRGGNVFAPFIEVPSYAWALYWCQFAVVGTLIWKAGSWRLRLKRSIDQTPQEKGS